MFIQQEQTAIEVRIIIKARILKCSWRDAAEQQELNPFWF